MIMARSTFLTAAVVLLLLVDQAASAGRVTVVPKVDGERRLLVSDRASPEGDRASDDGVRAILNSLAAAYDGK